MYEVSSIENFVRECAPMFCRFNFPREIKVTTVNEFANTALGSSIHGVDFSKCLAYSAPGGIIGVIYDNISKNKNERGFTDFANSLGFSICHELSHLEQDLNPIAYNLGNAYYDLIEIGNDLRTARTLLANIDLYTHLLKKYFNSTPDISSIEYVKHTGEKCVLCHRYAQSSLPKNIIERDLLLLFGTKNMDAVHIVENYLCRVPEYKVYVFMRNTQAHIESTVSEQISHRDFEALECVFKDIAKYQINIHYDIDLCNLILLLTIR